jgi:hypothetical protein
MNRQQQFQTFILERVRQGYQEQAQVLLDESLAKQASGTFDLDYLETWTKAMIPLIDENAWPEVRAVIKEFKANLKAKYQ